MSRFTPVLLLSFFIAACGGGQAQPRQVEVTRIVEQPVPVTVPIEITRVVERTVPVEVTRLVEHIITVTPRPATATPRPESTPSPDQGFALNWLAEQEREGLRIEIVRVLVGEINAIGQRMGTNFSELSAFEDTPTVGEIIFRLTNNAGQTYNIYPDQGTVLVNDEQIDLSGFMWYDVGDGIGGEIHAGIIKTGGLWFGIKRSTPEQIKAMTIIISAPSTTDYRRVGEDLRFELDLSNHIWELPPDELR